MAAQAPRPSAPHPPADDPGEPDEPTPDADAPGRLVELRIDGEAVQVVRPSLANPFVVGGGEFRAEEPVVLHSTPHPEGPSLGHLQEGVIDVIRGVPQTLRLQVSDPDGVGDILGYFVRFQGYEGAFWVPTHIDSEVFGASQREGGEVILNFFMDEVFPPGTERDADWAAGYDQAFDVDMLVWAVDRGRNVSPPIQQQLHVLPVGRGDLEVTLSMTLATDLDLYVVEPNGNVIYFGNMRSLTDGRLDLDANAACSSNRNVRYEHTYWPEGRAPEGTYQVRVDNWANCVGGRDVDFEVIVQNCGDISVHRGTASGPGGRSNCLDPRQSSCQHITNIEVGPCDARD